jgi:hypothetical protein
MKLKLYVCLVACALMSVTQAIAAPMNPGQIFLSVDINGVRFAADAEGPTQAGFDPWRVREVFDPFDSPPEDANAHWSANGGPPDGLSKSFSTSAGNITANLIGVGASRGARERGANSGGFPDLLRDFVFAQKSDPLGYGRNFIKLVLSGLNPGQTYEFTGFAREPAFNSVDYTSPTAPDVSFQAWSDLATMGADGPAAWLDTNGFAATTEYTVGNNPIPTLARSQTSGPDTLSNAGNPYYHSASFLTTADANGRVTIYTWSDPNTPGTAATTQRASLLNGFQLGTIPEPGTLLMFGMGLTFLIVKRRRTD